MNYEPHRRSPPFPTLRDGARIREHDRGRAIDQHPTMDRTEHCLPTAPCIKV